MSTSVEAPQNAINEVTGLPNEAAVNYIAGQMAEHFPGQFAEIAMDLDGLSEHNTLYGHRDANELLRATGEILTHTLRSEDTVGVVAHPHGDEFRMIVAGVAAQEQVDAITERLTAILDDYGISGSIGGRPHIVGETAEDLAIAADNLVFVKKLERKLDSYDQNQREFIFDMIREASQRRVKLRDIAFFAEALKDEPERLVNHTSPATPGTAV